MLLRAPWRIVPIVSVPPCLHVRDATMKTNDMNSIWVAMRWAIYRWLPGLMIALVLAELGLIRAGAWHATDNYMALAGYVPYSDAQDYLVGAFDQAYGGRWNWIASTRPLAAAFRQVTVLAGGHVYFYTLIVQAVLVGSSLALAARAVTRWHGPFSGLFFIALSALMIRPFVATTMTELLALTWSFAGVAFLLDAAHLRSKAHFVVAVALFILALMTRMGAMLLIPALILWGAFALGSTRSERAKVAAACIAVALGIWAVNAALSFLFGAHDANTGANFTYVACGLARGTNYQECLDAFADQLRPLMNDPTAVSAFLIRQTYEMILSNPSPFLGKLWANLSDFILDFPRLLLGGYGNPFDLTDNQTVVILVALLPGFLWAAWRATNAVRMLWLLVFLSIAASSAIVFGDAGWRALYASHPLLACLFSFGLAIPAQGAPLRWQRGAFAMGALLTAFFVAPPLSRFLLRSDVSSAGVSPQTETERVVAGAPLLTGFVVVADDDHRSHPAPSIKISDFAKVVGLTHLEDEFGPFVHALDPPFAYFWSPEIATSQSNAVYIAGPEVLERGDVGAWRFKLADHPSWKRPGSSIYQVETATPLPAR